MRRIVVLSLVLVGCMSCKKEKEACSSKTYDYTSDTPVDSVLLSYFFFNQGSYWVYEDEFNGGEDSVYVVSSGIKKISRSGKSASGCNGDITFVSFNSAYVNLSGTISPTSYTLSNSRMYLEGTPLYDYRTVFLKVENGEIQADSMVYYPNILIDGINYSEVYKIKANDKSGGVSQGSYLYINDSIGIVQKDLYQENGSYRRYYLKRYSIVKSVQ
jgi:hypothetical protein